MSKKCLESFKCIESWLSDSNEDTEKLIAACEIYTSATDEDREKYKQVLSEKWFSFDFGKNDVSLAEKKWMIFQEKLDDKIRRIVNKKDARSLDIFPIEVLRNLQKVGWIGKGQLQRNN
jgi:regulator of PEP synthase PpsR (kinase-PPPase family)